MKENYAGLTMIPLDTGLTYGSTTTLTLGAVGPYCIRGKAYTQAAVSAVQPSIVDLNTGVTLEGIEPGYGAVILVGATSSESTTLRMAQGKQVPLGADSSAYNAGDFTVPPQFPAMPEDFCPFGYVIVKVASDYTSGASYVFGSDGTTRTGNSGSPNSAATAFTNTFVSVMALPDRPQTS